MEPNVPAPTNPTNSNPQPETPRPVNDLQPALQPAPVTPDWMSAPSPQVISPTIPTAAVATEPAPMADMVPSPITSYTDPSSLTPPAPAVVAAPAMVSPADNGRASFTPPMPTVTPAAALPTDMFANTPSQPVYGQPVVNGTVGIVPPSGYTPTKVGKSPFGKSKLPLLAVAVVALLLLGGGGYTFAYYLPNRPTSIFAKSLENSGKAVDKLIAYAEAQDTQSSVQGSTFDGSLKYTSAAVSTDITLKGAYDKEANATANITADVAGQNIAVNLISVHKSGSNNPDLYFQVKGVKSFLDAAGQGRLDSLDGQWIAVDHTLLDSAESATAGGSSQSTPTAAEINDAVTKAEIVNKQYIFTTDPNTAVIVNQKYITKEKMDGANVDHFQASYNKDHLKAYLGALKTALDASKLNDWSQKSSKKSLSDQLGISTLQSGVESAKPYSFDLYADTDSKLIHAMTFKNTTNGNETVTISQNYKTDGEYPFAIRDVAQDTSGGTSDFTVGYILNTKANSAKFTINGTSNGSNNSGKTTVSGNFNLSPSSTPVQVSAPAGSKSVLDIANQLGLGSALSGTSLGNSGITGASTKLTTKSPFTLIQ